ncbi:olfactory receptor 10A7-like, partial [Bombina bombina]|uniref:olfactory receptor 10A7-like n=1 Tax=Bombina bombina TaxID=8345 RepID=UPI00235AC25D
LQIMKENQTYIKEFLMLGFQTSQIKKILIFTLFLMVYVLTLGGNVLIITLVLTSNHLRSPMYFFLSNLSVCEIMLTTNVVPNMLYLLLMDCGTMTVVKCFVQFYFFGTAATTECFLLAVMSYDRFLAICNPLRYTSVMDQRLCFNLALTVWALGFMATIGTIILLCKLEFCGPNVIDHYFCDREPILHLSCSDTFLVRAESLVFSFIITLFPFIIIIWSYFSIIVTILKMSTTVVRKKAFSTCSSHLMVVSLYYGTLIMMYVAPSSGDSFNVNKLLSLLYTVVTPLLNPIIYSLRNKDIKNALKLVVQRILLHAMK